MFKIKDNKTGITDSSVNSNNKDDGNYKNNKSKEHLNIKNSNLENSNNSQNFNNNQGLMNVDKIDKVENNYYQKTKAKEDSKNDQLLKIIELKDLSLTRIYEIRDTYLACKNCKEIFKKEISEMFEKLKKQIEFKGEFGILDEEAWNYSIVPITQELSILANDFEQTVRFENTQKNYLNNYRAMRPGYFQPCKEHSMLVREWQRAELKIKDYDFLIRK